MSLRRGGGPVFRRSGGHYRRIGRKSHEVHKYQNDSDGKHTDEKFFVLSGQLIVIDMQLLYRVIDPFFSLVSIPFDSTKFWILPFLFSCNIFCKFQNSFQSLIVFFNRLVIVFCVVLSGVEPSLVP